MTNFSQTRQQHPLPTSPKREDLPTMYDLPSEVSGEPGLPDQFHPIQATLLNLVFQPRTYPSERVFSALDLNLYYDPENTRRYKRPDWFGVVGVSRLYAEEELRWSYVVWDEGVNPFILVELLSPSTKAQDLGEIVADPDGSPTKWEVYEQILQVPYYVVYDRNQNYFRAFHLENQRYQEIELSNNRFWMEELGLGLGLWQGSYEGVDRLWLRFYDAAGNWIPTPTEQERERANLERERAELERQRADRERQERETAQQRLERLEALLRENNINFDNR